MESSSAMQNVRSSYITATSVNMLRYSCVAKTQQFLLFSLTGYDCAFKVF